MTKTEYIAAIEADLTAANNLCAELRTLRNFKKIAEGIADSDKMVSFDVLGQTITSKEAELQKIRSTLGKNRRIVKKLEEIEAIETGAVDAPGGKKTATKEQASAGESKGKKSTGKRATSRTAKEGDKADGQKQEEAKQSAA